MVPFKVQFPFLLNMMITVKSTFELLDIKCNKILFIVMLDICWKLWHNQQMNPWVINENRDFSPPTAQIWSSSVPGEHLPQENFCQGVAVILRSGGIKIRETTTTDTGRCFTWVRYDRGEGLFFCLYVVWYEKIGKVPVGLMQISKRKLQT